MNQYAQIFTESKEIALLGASGRRKKFGNMVLKELTKRGFNIYPVHLTAEKINGRRTYRKISELPNNVATACICMKPAFVKNVISELIESDIQNIWFQQGSDYSELAGELTDAGKNVIVDKCVLMYAGKPTGFHAIHKFFAKLFGKY